MDSRKGRITITVLMAVALIATFFLAGCGSEGGSADRSVWYSGGGTSGTGTITGTVVGPVRANTPTTPIVGATITCVGTSLSATSDTSGNFTLPGVPSGLQSFECSRTGYTTQTVTGTVVANSTISIFTPGSSQIVMNVDPVTGKKQWTLFVYIAGDNTLDDYVDFNINQMETVGSSADVNMVVLADKPGVTTKVYYITKDSDPATVTSPYSDFGVNIDSGDYNNLTAFLQNGVAAYPANNYLVDLWDHGSGFFREDLEKMARLRKKGAYPRLKSRGICYDDTSGTGMTIIQVGTSLAAAKTAMGQNVNILACDACYMAGIEVAYEWKNYCDFFVASEETIPGEGFPYDTVVAHPVSNPTITPLAYSKAIVDDYGTYYDANGDGRQTLSAIQMSMIDDLSTKVSAYSAALRVLLPAATVAGNIWDNAYYGNTIYFGYKDLIDLYSFALNEYTLCNTGASWAPAESLAVQQALVLGDAKVVVANYCGAQYNTSFGMDTAGLSIWRKYDLTPIDPATDIYAELQWWSNDWHNFIDWINDNQT